jgi:hypothetical protein
LFFLVRTPYVVVHITRKFWSPNFFLFANTSVISVTKTCIYIYIYIYICTRVYQVVNFEKFLSSKGHNSHKIPEIKIAWQYAQLHMVSLLPTKFHEILVSSFNFSETTEENFMKLGR